MSFREKFGSYFVQGIVLFSIVIIAGATLGSCSNYLRKSVTPTREVSREEYFERVKKAADTNQDRTISKEEWKKVYDEIGVPYSDDSRPYLDLKKSQLEKYLENHY